MSKEGARSWEERKQGAKGRHRPGKRSS